MTTRAISFIYKLNETFLTKKEIDSLLVNEGDDYAQYLLYVIADQGLNPEIALINLQHAGTDPNAIHPLTDKLPIQAAIDKNHRETSLKIFNIETNTIFVRHHIEYYRALIDYKASHDIRLSVFKFLIEKYGLIESHLGVDNTVDLITSFASPCDAVKILHQNDITLELQTLTKIAARMGHTQTSLQLPVAYARVRIDTADTITLQQPTQQGTQITSRPFIT